MLLAKSRYLGLAQICILVLLTLYLLTIRDQLSNLTSLKSSLKGQLHRVPPPENAQKTQGNKPDHNVVVSLGSNQDDNMEGESQHHEGGKNDQEESNRNKHKQDVSKIKEPLKENNQQDGGKPKDELPIPKKQPPTLFVKASKLIPSILDAENTSIDRLICPPINTARYGYLRPSTQRHNQRKYIFTLNLRQCIGLLPRLMGSVVEAIRFLGPQNCAVSIVEGHSDDGTLEVLRLLKKELSKIGVDFYLSTSPIDPKTRGQTVARIKDLALLRTLALEPILGRQKTLPAPVQEKDLEEARATLGIFGNDDDLDGYLEYQDGQQTNRAKNHPPPPNLHPDATILFVNDVIVCPEDLLELVHQRHFQSADMTCSLDWYYGNNAQPSGRPGFYDVWISRDILGDIFFDIPGDTGSFANASDLFPFEPVARARAAIGQPFQVFACWNGAVAFAARPLAEGVVGFRWSRAGECFQGEPQLLCKDLWWEGYGRIAVVPSVNVIYDERAAAQIKKDKGFVSDWVAMETDLMGGKWVDDQDGVEIVGKGYDGDELKIKWQLEPPEMVKCLPGWNNQVWMGWNESLVDDGR